LKYGKERKQKGAKTEGSINGRREIGWWNLRDKLGAAIWNKKVPMFRVVDHNIVGDIS
jgi:hypothetical protein